MSSPAPVMWDGFEDGIFVGYFNPLLEDSVLQCTAGGKIEIFYSLEEATAACAEAEEESSFWETLGKVVLVVAAVALIIVTGGAALAAIAAVGAASGALATGIAVTVAALEVAGCLLTVKALYDYSQDGDEEALFKEVALGFLFLGAGKVIEKGFRMWKAGKAAKAGDQLLEVGEELSERAMRQQDVIDDVQNGVETLGTNKRKGNYGEMKMDRHLEDITEINGNPANLSRLGDDAVESLDQTIAKGIDGVYENANPPPQYIIAEAKYNTSKLGNTLDGPQMSDDWINGSDRLTDAVGEEAANQIRLAKMLDPESVQSVLVHIDPAGNVTTSAVDALGNVAGAWP
ncbi:hypothetical protein [Zobellia uliginosa]|uniref:hypothetical protein n=1 Tax=Zobellia uliginosa TaxID=143224 RepID=UPI002090B43A|nr:hypothetical protein [Zobellia uliginosa]